MMEKILHMVRLERAKQMMLWGTMTDRAFNSAGELAQAAAALAASNIELVPDGEGWQGFRDHFYRGKRVEQLVKAAAMLVAEIERITPA